MPRSRSIPAYRLHRPTGQAVVSIRLPEGGYRDVYLGKHGTPKSHAEYARVIAELSVATTPAVVTEILPSTRITIDELLLAFLQFAHRHYRRPDGSPTDGYAEYLNAVKPVHRLYGDVPVREFGPLALRAVRQEYVNANNCRNVVNARTNKVRRIFKWGVSEQLVPIGVFQSLACVLGLQAGRSEARESTPVEPVDDAVVDATLPYMNRFVRGLVQLQRLTGCRPSEAMALRRSDLDTTGEVWVFKPQTHKTAHRGKSRTIAIGPRAQVLLREYFTADIDDFLFSPRRAVAERNARSRAARKTKITPSQAARRPKENPKRPPAARYNRRSYYTAVRRACQKAKVELWNPYRIRHSFASDVRHAHGLEAAQVLLGHTKADVTQLYAERDEALAVRIAAAVG